MRAYDGSNSMRRTLPAESRYTPSSSTRPGHPAEAGRQPVDAGEGREGVVDGGRERPDGDLDQLVDGENGVLHERPVRSGDVGLGQRPGHLGRRAPRPDHGQRPPGGQEVARPVLESDHRVGTRRDGDQLRVADVLDVAAHLRRHCCPALLYQLEQLGDGLPPLERQMGVGDDARPGRETRRRWTPSDHGRSRRSPPAAEWTWRCDG